MVLIQKPSEVEKFQLKFIDRDERKYEVRDLIDKQLD